jgi:hypothetical protein
MPEDAPFPVEIPSGESLVEAYNAVFSIKGGAPLLRPGAHVEYVEDLLRRLVGANPWRPLDLAGVRAMPEGKFLQILFKAVAGNFISGPSALRSDVCRLEADQVTGTIEVTRDGGDNEVVLTVISLILLCVLGVMMYRREQQIALESAAAAAEGGAGSGKDKGAP